MILQILILGSELKLKNSWKRSGRDRKNQLEVKKIVKVEVRVKVKVKVK